MARKGENIYKRKDGRWEGRYIKGKKENGRLQYGYIYGYRYQDVKKKLLPLKSYYLTLCNPQSEFSGTLRDWSNTWMNEMVRTKVKPSTYASYDSLLENHILPKLGDIKLTAITRTQVQDFIDSFDQLKLGASTVRNIYNMLNRIIKAAVRKNVLLVNPCLEIDLPEKKQKHVSALTLIEQKRLEVAALNDKDGLSVMLALYTGMRIGEICALRWDDVDLNRRQITVKQTIQRIKNADTEGEKTKIVFGEPKSKCSRRIIPITNKLFNILKKEKRQSNDEYVISCNGGFAEPRIIRYRYYRIRKAAHIDHLHFHGLRHTFSTRCIEQDIDIPTLSRLLGHSSIKMTLDIYVDVTMEHRASSIQRLDHLFKTKTAQKKEELKYYLSRV